MPSPPPVVAVDGRCDEWSAGQLLYSDARGDAAPGTCDLGRLWAAHTDLHLFLRLEVGLQINIQEPSGLALLIDADTDPTTGQADGGIGAELVWPFGTEYGMAYRDGQATPLTHAQIGLVTAPTVTSSTFEIRLDRRAHTPQGALLFAGPRLAIAFRAGPDGDRLPDAGVTLAYSLEGPPVHLPEAISLGRADSVDLRVATYNTWKSGLLDPKRGPAFRRILAAVRPDVLGLEEMDPATAAPAAAWLGDLLGGTFHHAQVADNVLLSRHPVTRVQEVGANGAFVVDPRPGLPRPMLFVVAHPPCCRRDADRQREIDQIMGFLRQARQSPGELGLAPGAPIFVMGDMNLVGFAQQLQTLLEGEIVDRATFGPAFAPDWDGTGLADLGPPHTHAPFTFTWFRASERFTPGRLDFLLYA
ncbi:MAG: endonuclease/exonuclease/phosphatase family protein, partial [Candidatus Latescibacterota bacterium]